MSARLPFAVLLGLCCLPAFGQGADDGGGDENGSVEFAVNEAIAAQRAVRAEAEAELERLLAREAGEVLAVGEPIASRGDSLADALANFGEKAGLPVLLDQPALDIDGIELRDIILGDPPVVPRAVPVTLRRMLGLLLEHSGEELTAVNDGGLLRITTVVEAELKLVTRTYDVRDLVRYRATRAASAGLLLDAYAPAPISGGGGGLGGGGLGGGELGGGGLGGGLGGGGSMGGGAPRRSGRGAGGFGGGAFSLPTDGTRAAATVAATVPAFARRQDQGPVTAADRAAAEWEARLKFFERRLELLPGEPDDAVYGYDFGPLIDLLITSTGGQDNGGLWQDEGGLGSVEELETGPAGSGRAVLVIRQTDPVHRQIVDLLNDLRAAPGEELEPAEAGAADEGADAAE